MTKQHNAGQTTTTVPCITAIVVASIGLGPKVRQGKELANLMLALGDSGAMIHDIRTGFGLCCYRRHDGAIHLGRPRYDIVACIALLISVALGLVKPEEAFNGFSDDIVVIVASALVVSGAIAQTGIPEFLLQRISRHINSIQAQMFVLVATVMVLSAFVKNVGALAIMIPVAFQMAKHSNAPPSFFLMPMSFGALLGGLMTQIGTSPNIIVSRVRGEIVGTPFSMFDFTPLGVVLSATGLLFLVLAYRILPVRTRSWVCCGSKAFQDCQQRRETERSGTAAPCVPNIVTSPARAATLKHPVSKSQTNVWFLTSVR